ncbi:MAG: nucleotidyltransferase domain-containing protein [Spirochaetota bacterium]
MNAKKLSIIIDKVCHSDEQVAAAYLLGSRADGTARPDSDIDVALLPVRGHTLDGLARVSIGSGIAFRTGLDADVGVLSTRNLVYAREAILKGIRVFSRDPEYTNYMEMLFLSMYGQYHEDRRELVDAFAL